MDWKDEHPHYTYATLDDTNLPPSPWPIWNEWIDSARKILKYTNEIALATSNLRGEATVRMVLLKYASEAAGFCWFTNKKSQKGLQLTENPQAEILWYVREQQRQIRIRGTVAELAREEVIAYALSRPIKSQVSAYISEQSSPIESKQALVKKFELALEKYNANSLDTSATDAHADNGNNNVPCSENWTGYSLGPLRFEFWQGNSDRLHDRIIYTLQDNQQWDISRLQP